MKNKPIPVWTNSQIVFRMYHQDTETPLRHVLIKFNPSTDDYWVTDAKGNNPEGPFSLDDAMDAAFTKIRSTPDAR